MHGLAPIASQSPGTAGTARMIFRQLDQMRGGWFIGNFAPTCLDTREFEVAVKHYRAGVREPSHVHRMGREFTVIVAGRALFNGREVDAGAIVEISPGEAVAFESVTDVITVVVKTPSVVGDKYPSDGEVP